MNPKEQDDFYNQHGINIHTDPSRFSAIAEVCRGSVLDIACGTGDLADFYDGEYLGIDQSVVAIEMAESVPRENAKFLADDVLKLILANPIKQDTVVMAEFLEHIKEWEKYCQLMIGKMKSGARLVITVPNGDRVPDDDHVVEFTVPMMRKIFSSYGRVKFYNYDGFNARILMSLDVGEKIEKRLSLGMFCKNEALGLETAILSCINIVDDSTTDDTLNIAKRYGEVARLFKWEDSFCKARNLVQSVVTRPWVLILDGHEFVKSSPHLYDMLKFDGDGLMIKVRLEDGFTFDFPRIIRKDVDWEFDVHNNAQCKKVKMYSNFLIQHDRENLQTKEAADMRVAQRTKMIEKVMFDTLKKDKKNSRSYFYLGELYFSLKKYKLARKFWKKYLKYGSNKQERWLVCFNIAAAYIQRGIFPLALHWLKKADKEMPNRWETKKARGLTYLFLYDYEKAVQFLIYSMEGPKEKVIYSPMAFDLFDTWDKVSTCFRRLNRHQECLVALKRALECAKTSELTDNIKQRIKITKEYVSAQ